MNYEWPDLVFPPINLWNMPKQNIFRRNSPQSTSVQPSRAVQDSKRETLHRLMSAR